MRKMAFGILILCSVCFGLEGCAVSPQITNTPRSSIEQELLVSSLERGFETLDTQRLAGATVTVDFLASHPTRISRRNFSSHGYNLIRCALSPIQAKRSCTLKYLLPCSVLTRRSPSSAVQLLPFRFSG